MIQRVLPQLCLEFSNHQMIPFVLPNVLLIAEDCTTQEFCDLILPELKPVFKIQDPSQVSCFPCHLCLLSNFVQVLTHLSEEWTFKVEIRNSLIDSVN